MLKLRRSGLSVSDVERRWPRRQRRRICKPLVAAATFRAAVPWSTGRAVAHRV